MSPETASRLRPITSEPADEHEAGTDFEIEPGQYLEDDPEFATAYHQACHEYLTGKFNASRYVEPGGNDDVKEDYRQRTDGIQRQTSKRWKERTRSHQVIGYDKVTLWQNTSDVPVRTVLRKNVPNMEELIMDGRPVRRRAIEIMRQRHPSRTNQYAEAERARIYLTPEKDPAVLDYIIEQCRNDSEAVVAGIKQWINTYPDKARVYAKYKLTAPLEWNNTENKETPKYPSQCYAFIHALEEYFEK